ncbi:protein of unknown function [Legionella fallonii LLAP-10]|uniref:Uncharacterized protein n=1 Tax=Legionella fallonii LLAP-10 TaxID=1212491 RepID=A0A098G437_9GAMM|nr:protein of unknown function [Legionella fallonii LLAP-10]
MTLAFINNTTALYIRCYIPRAINVLLGGSQDKITYYLIKEDKDGGRCYCQGGLFIFSLHTRISNYFMPTMEME